MLSNKTIGAALQLVIYTDENKSKTRSVTLSTTGTLRGYPYELSDSNERTKTEVQGKFTSERKQSVSLVEISISDSHHLQQKNWAVNKEIKDADATGTIEDYTEGTETEIAELSNITCYGISDVKLIEITPKEEDYFTGDFYASSGFFKNKYTNFTTGMVTDVFSLP